MVYYYPKPNPNLAKSSQARTSRAKENQRKKLGFPCSDYPALDFLAHAAHACAFVLPLLAALLVLLLRVVGCDAQAGELVVGPITNSAEGKLIDVGYVMHKLEFCEMFVSERINIVYITPNIDLLHSDGVIEIILCNDAGYSRNMEFTGWYDGLSVGRCVFREGYYCRIWNGRRVTVLNSDFGKICWGWYHSS